MAELPDSAGSGRRGVDAGDGERPPDAQDRPRLVAVPRDEPAATHDSHPGAARPPDRDPHVARLQLERALTARPRTAFSLPARSSAPGETDAAARATAAAVPAAPTGAVAAGEGAGLAEPVPSATPELVTALRAELAMRASAEAGLRARAVDAETRLAARAMASQRTVETLREIRAEFERLAVLVADERRWREAAERRVVELERELGELREPHDRTEPAQPPGGRELDALRDSLEQLRTPAPEAEHDPLPTAAAASVQPDRLADALTRLRASAPPLEPAPAPAVPATLAGPFRTLCRRDPALAGRLAISLLGMERIAYPHPIAFDLLLGPGGGCIQVTSSALHTKVVAAATARPLEQVGFRVAGGPDRLARLLVAGRWRRRLGFGLARVRGDKDGLAALEALLALPLDLPALVDGGMLSDSTALLSLAAAMVAPEWTRGAHFVVSHRDGDSPTAYLVFSGGRRPEVTSTAPAGPIATAIVCSGRALASVLTGRTPAEATGVELVGDLGPLSQLQGWIKRAQSA